MTHPVQSRNTTVSPYASPQNPCPICGGTSSSCRHSKTDPDNIYWCMKAGVDTTPADGSGGWVHAHDLASGFGSAWKRTGGSGVYAPKTEKQKGVVHIEDDELNRLYRLTFAQLDLSYYHGNLLEKRGVSSAQAKRWGLVTWTPNKKVSGIGTLPGLNNDRLYGHRGFVIPAYTPWGKIIGFQTANDNRTPKYSWVKNLSDTRGGKLPLFSAHSLPTYERPERFPSGILEVSFEMRRSDTAEGLPLRNGAAVVSAALYSNSGRLIEVATKSFCAVTRAQAELNSLLLGLQLARGVVGSIDIRGISETIAEEAQMGANHTHHETLARICRELLDERCDGTHTYSFTDNRALPTITETSETKKAGEQYLDTKTVWLCDGASKAFYTANQHSVVCLGFPMANFTLNNHEFQQYLRAYGAEKIIHAPDAGDVTNKSNIPVVNARLHESIERHGYDLSIAWWGQRDKTDVGEPGNDIDDLESLTDVRYISAQEFRELHPEEARRQIDPYYFRKPGIYQVPDAVLYPRKVHTESPTVFPEGERLKYVRSFGLQHRVVLDTSRAGSGKSFDYTAWEAHELGAHRLIHVVANAIDRDTTVPAYRGRDSGRILDPNDGRILTAPADHDGELYLTANCERANYARDLSEANVIPESKKVCAGCQVRETCESTKGWYWHDRREVMQQTKFRVTPAGLAPEMIVDAVGIPFNKSESKEPGTILVLDDVDAFVSTLTILPDEIRSFVDRFDTFLNRKPTLKNSLLELADLADIGDARSGSEVLSSMRGLHYDEEFAVTLHEAEESLLVAAIAKKERAPKRWFSELYKALGNINTKRYHAHTYGGAVCVSFRNERFMQCLMSAGVRQVIIADATARPEDVRYWFGLDSRIPTIQQEKPEQEANVRHFQITGLGDCGYSRSERQLNRIETLSAMFEQRYPNGAVIDTKKNAEAHNSEIVLTHRASSRGSNRAKGVDALLVVGTPRANVSALSAKWSLMTGRSVEPGSTLINYPMRFRDKQGSYTRTLTESTDPEFAEYCYRNTLAEIQQGYARTRFSRRAGEKIDIYHLTEFPLDCEVERVNIDRLLGGFGMEPRRSACLISEQIDTAASEIARSGSELSRAAVSRFLGVTTGVVRSYFNLPGRSWSVYRDGVIAGIAAQSVLQETTQATQPIKPESDIAIYSNKPVVERSTDYVRDTAIPETHQDGEELRSAMIVRFFDRDRLIVARTLDYNPAAKGWDCEPISVDRVPVLFHRIVTVAEEALILGSSPIAEPHEVH